MEEISEMRHCPHCGGRLDSDRIIEWGGWSFDEGRRRFVAGTPGGKVYFTPNEAALIAAVLRKHGKPASRSGDLMSAVCAGKSVDELPEEKIVDVYISKLRKKLRQENLLFFRTVWGRGYEAIEYDPNPVFKEYGDRKIIHVGIIRSKLAQPCDCGHIKSHHQHYGHSKGRGRPSYCLVTTCLCKAYNVLSP